MSVWPTYVHTWAWASYAHTCLQHTCKRQVLHGQGHLKSSRMLTARVRRALGWGGHVTWNFHFMRRIGSEQLFHNMETIDDYVLGT